MADAQRGSLGRRSAAAGPLGDAVDKLSREFAGERVSAAQRAETKLSQELAALDGLRLSGAPADAFNAQRAAVLRLRGELIVQREASGRTIEQTAAVEKQFPVPPVM